MRKGSPIMRLMKGIQNTLIHIKLQKQLYFTYLSTILISILVIGTMLVYNTYSLMMTHYKEQADADNLRVKSILYDLTTSIYNMSSDLFSDSTLQNILSARYATEEESISACQSYETFTENLELNTSISSITLYTSNPTIVESDYFKPITKDIQNTAWFHQAKNQLDVIWFSGERLDTWGHTYQELQLIRKIPVLSQDEYAILVINISYDYLKNRIRNENYKTILTVNQEPIFYSSDRERLGEKLTIPIDYSQSYFRYTDVISYQDKKSIAALSTFSPVICEDMLYIVTLDENGLKHIHQLTATCLLIIALVIVLPFFFVISFANLFNNRINTLRTEMHKVSQGNYDIIEQFNGDDELTELFADLKSMIGSIMKMDAQIYEAKLSKQQFINAQQKMEFSMLTSQINPHFLYNTLETIRMKALTEGNKDVATAIKMLGQSMRYVLENNVSSSTTLKKELNYIAIYLAIQKMRFGARINYTITIHPDIDPESYKILPLLIQPVVENAILHGLGEKEVDGHILIRIEPDDNFLTIQIKDNGCGISQELLLTLREQIKIPHKSSATNIGLNNIYQRIKLYYRDAYDLSIDSIKGAGTTVTLQLPRSPDMEVR